MNPEVTPFNPRRPARRACRIALAALLLGATGCALLGGVGPAVPKNYFERCDPERLTDPRTQGEAYRALFPAQPKLEIHGAMLRAHRRWASDIPPLRLNYAALESGTVRMRAFKPQVAAPFFDLTLANGWMTVVLGRTSEAFVGSVSSHGGAGEASPGSPFGQVFGVEPGDLWGIFDLGRRIGASEWKSTRHWRTVELEPPAPAQDGLQWVELDRRTGLPRAAQWRRGANRWEVRYGVWDWYEDARVTPGRGEVYLMPGQVEVRSRRPRLTLTLEMGEGAGYRFGESVPPKMFQAPALGRGRVYPLDRLKEALTGS